MGLCYKPTLGPAELLQQDMDVDRVNNLIRLILVLVCFMCIMWVVTCNACFSTICVSYQPELFLVNVSIRIKLIP